MFISCPRRQETNQRNAARGWGGFNQAKAIKAKERQKRSAFAWFQHLPLAQDPTPTARSPFGFARAWVCQSVEGNFISRPSNCSRDFFWDEAKKLVLRYVLGSTLLNYRNDSEGIFSLAKKA